MRPGSDFQITEGLLECWQLIWYKRMNGEIGRCRCIAQLVEGSQRKDGLILQMGPADYKHAIPVVPVIRREIP